MDHAERGIAMIFNNRKYDGTDDKAHLKDRIGSEMDVNRLATQLRQLGFKVTVYTDIRPDDTHDAIKKTTEGNTL